MKKSHPTYMASVNIVPIETEHDSKQPVTIRAIGDEQTLTQNTLLPDGTPIESLNNLEQWTDEKGEVWILPKSKMFPDFIKSKYGNAEYMSSKEHFLDQIVSVINSGSKEEAPPFPYQKFVRDYLRIGTPYRSLLLEHGLGSGKTRSTIMVAKTFREAGLKTLILTPAFLRLNFLSEIQKWEDPNINIEAWYKFAHYNATGNSPGKKDANGEDIGGKGGIFEQLASIGIGFRRDDKQYGNLFPYINKKYRHELKPPEHMLIIVEEAHNLNRSFVASGHGGSKVKSLLYPLLMQATDCKFIFLSGTPMISNPFEVAPMYNILRGPLESGHHAFPDDENTFNSHFVDYTNRSFNKLDIMMSRMIGLNSYFVGITEDTQRAIFPARKDHIIHVVPSPFQTQIHDIELDSELNRSKPKKKDKLAALPGSNSEITMSSSQADLTTKGSYHTRSRAACNFVFPNTIIRPRSGKKDAEALKQHVFEFQLLKGKEREIKDPAEYDKIFTEIMDEVEFEGMEELQQQYLEDYEELKNGSASALERRKYLSKVFVEQFQDFLSKNNGMPTTIEFHKRLSTADKQMIDRTVGPYEKRLKAALLELADPERKYLSLKKLKQCSAKMYAIYKTIVENKEAGAPHLVSGSGSKSDASGSGTHPSESEPEDYPSEFIDEEEDIDPEEKKEQIPTDTKVTAIDDPDDPLNMPEFNVFRSDEDLRREKKKVVGGPSMVYSYFSSAEGAGIFSMVLEAHGFQPFTEVNLGPRELPRRKRYAFFRGGMDQALKRNILRVFNSRENVNGQLIRVLFVTQAAAEGISLYNLRQIHIMEPHWDNVMIEQVIGRGFRLLAHKFIADPQEREINVFRYFCKRPEKEVLDTWYQKATKRPEASYYDKFTVIKSTAKMADDMIQQIADEKDKFRLKLNDIRIKVAVDCYLNSLYNNPKDGCFTYRDMSGPAYGTEVKDDISVTKIVKSQQEKVQVQFLSIKHKDPIGKKNYFYYPGKDVKLKFEQKPNLYQVIKLYGPIKEIPDSEFIVPESAMHAGYFHIASKKFIPPGEGKEV